MRTVRLPAPTILLVLFFGIGFLFTNTTARADAQNLQTRYEQLKPKLASNVYGIPIYIESNGDDGTARGDAFSIITHPFDKVRHALGKPAGWCDIVPLHLNIKACTYRHEAGQCRLSLYSGRKFYERADDVYKIEYLYTQKADQADYFNLALTADEGPLDTGDYNISVEAIPLGDNSTFIHFSYSYQHGLVTNLAMQSYFLTLGLGKVGFSVLEKDTDGEPVYVQGIRGVIERNAIRYYFAIQSYLDTLYLPRENRFQERLSHWFDLTERYARQLHELDKPEYLDYKRRERKDQLRLQAAVNAGSDAEANGKCLVNGFGKQ